MGEEEKEVKQAITSEDVKNAEEKRKKYKKSKEALNNRVKEAEKWFRLMQWEVIAPGDDQKKPHPTSAWLFNSIINKHADGMDNYPEPNILPREEGDKPDAKMLSDILPVILEHNDFESTYDQAWWDVLKYGTAVYGVFWNKELENGLGDIDIKHIDILDLDWEPGIEDIQDSKNLFFTRAVDNELLEKAYPQLVGKLGNSTLQEGKWDTTENLSMESMSPVVDWYYKKKIRTQTGYQTVLHYVKYCAGEVLYATENDTNVPTMIGTDGNPMPTGKSMAEIGLYDHGKYPFILHTLFPLKGSPAGFGFIDITKDVQIQIDKLDQIILKNSHRIANRKTFVSDGAGINTDDYTNPEIEIVSVSGNVDDSKIKQEEIKELPAFIYNFRAAKIDELKEVSGNRDFSQGGTTSGVTAASAIAALQEAGSKLSRDEIKQSYRKFRDINYMMIELIRQFYTETRFFRITGENGVEQFVEYQNQNLNKSTNELGIESIKRPVFDIKVTSQKASPFTKIAQNELAKELYQLGVFNPQNSDMALSMLNMMDFEGKDLVEQKISQNGTMLQMIQQMQLQIQQMATIIDATTGSTLSQAVMMQQNPQAEQIQDTSAVSTNNPLAKAVQSAQNTTPTTARDKAQNVVAN